MPTIWERLERRLAAEAELRAWRRQAATLRYIGKAGNGGRGSPVNGLRALNGFDPPRFGPARRRLELHSIDWIEDILSTEASARSGRSPRLTLVCKPQMLRWRVGGWIDQTAGAATASRQQKGSSLPDATPPSGCRRC